MNKKPEKASERWRRRKRPGLVTEVLCHSRGGEPPGGLRVSSTADGGERHSSSGERGPREERVRGRNSGHHDGRSRKWLET